MEENLKQLLLKDLCARLPYGVKGLTLGTKTCTLVTLMSDGVFKADTCVGHITAGQFKPYLRPMSSMTDEEDKDWQYYKTKIAESCDELLDERIAELHDWFNRKHLDFRHLIKKGLALEAPEGMYKV